MQVTFENREGRGLPFGDRTGRFAGDCADLPLQVAQARLPGVVGDDPADRPVVKTHAIGGQPVLLQFPGNEVAPRDLDLLLFRVPRQLDDLHAVAQRLRYAGQHIGRGHEHDVGQVEGQIDEVIGKSVVLLRVEHFEQRRGRVSPEIPAELVYLVQHEDRVVGARLADALDDAARQRADVGPSVSPDLRFVMHASQRNAHEPAAQGAGDRPTQRGLAHTRRSNETQDGTLQVRLQAPYGQVFEDAVLDLLEAVVVFVQDLPGPLDAQLIIR